MNFTFGIVTSGQEDYNVQQVINSIESLNIPEYEILVIGNSDVSRLRTKVIPFNENVKSKWITKKKNLITENAKYNNIVYLHDYVLFQPDWYQGFLHYGEDYNVCMTRMLNKDGTRYRDWCIWPHNDNFVDGLMTRQRGCLIPYDMTHLSEYMYFSGTYWVGKKDVMTEFPLNENLCWGQSEDVDWSLRVRTKYNFSINKFSSVKLMKFKDRAFDESDELTIQQLNLIAGR
jgi:hypothetical protein